MKEGRPETLDHDSQAPSGCGSGFGSGSGSSGKPHQPRIPVRTLNPNPRKLSIPPAPALPAASIHAHMAGPRSPRLEPPVRLAASFC